MKYSREGFAQVTKDMVNKRRQLLKDNKMDEYKILFFELDKREDSFTAEMLHKGLKFIGLSEEEIKASN